jgi:glycine cleavage system H protein
MASEPASNVPSDRKFTKDHEWAQTNGSAVKVGITAYAVEQLGDITLLNLDVKVGDTVEAGKAFGTIESVKTLSDLYAPVSGKVKAVNGELDSKPELVNADCYSAWMVEIETSADLAELLDADAYADLVAKLDH